MDDRQRRRNLARALRAGLRRLEKAAPTVPAHRVCLLAQESACPDVTCLGVGLYWRTANGQGFLLIRLFLVADAHTRSTDELLATLADLYLEATASLGEQPVVLSSLQTAPGAQVARPPNLTPGDPLLRQANGRRHPLRDAA